MRIKPAAVKPAGLHPIASMIFDALKTYGCYVADNSGRSKIYLEDRITAGWPSSFTADSLGVPWSSFEFVAGPPGS